MNSAEPLIRADVSVSALPASWYTLDRVLADDFPRR